MEVKSQDQIAFYLTGRHHGELRPLGSGFRPALFASYEDLASLRYDFPLLLNRKPGRGPVLSLSALVDEAIGSLRDDPQHDRIARHAYEIERELRREFTQKNNGIPAGHGDFAALWNGAVTRMPSQNGLLEDSAKRLWSLFNVSGELVDVDFAIPSRIAQHVWNVVQQQKAKTFHDHAARLLLKLHGILLAEHSNSEAGRTPERLKASVGTSFSDAFDFDVMSRVLVRAKPGIRISDDRRNRIQHLIEVLETQRFFPMRNEIEAYDFVFYRCSDAMHAYRERRRAAAEVLKALTVADLEVKGEYRESELQSGIPTHDALLDQFGADGLDANELAQLPEYLICKYSSELDAEETLQIIDALSTGIPIKIFLQTDDLLESAGISHAAVTANERHISLASRSRHVLDTAMRLGDVYVAQASVSQLYQLRYEFERGMAYRGPAFFSVFSGATGHDSNMPPYLVAAAATECRAFPTIVYDPSAGEEWSDRCRIDMNPEASEPWSTHTFEYEDESHQYASEELAFTFADFVAMDSRFKDHFAVLPSATLNATHRSVTESLERAKTQRPTAVPVITLIDSQGHLKRAIVSRRILEENRRTQQMWHSLQELGGIHNSYAERLVEQLKRQLEEAAIEAPPLMAAATAEAVVAVAEFVSLEVTERNNDEPYIETARCTTCNECTQVNAKMFVYNDEKQAHIADANAGTYRQLVEAAEGCQVSIIHPGKPRNMKEPGLDELLKRAEPFM